MMFYGRVRRVDRSHGVYLPLGRSRSLPFFTSFRPSSDSSISGATADAVRFSERTRVPIYITKECRAQQPSDLKSELAVSQTHLTRNRKRILLC
ncbi:hypothetical protein RvY_02337-2 [Ramazzottius varieornatus]|uniref:Uncharacterized protein n=1 Tax=Ramazzottius varieornatus TaxID=947166 RepID=A0A1D1UJC3_RAMVA|nr:hypothetical protein RvY_02337-2 [Ramazzottius varieornatus]